MGSYLGAVADSEVLGIMRQDYGGRAVLLLSCIGVDITYLSSGMFFCRTVLCLGTSAHW